MLKLRLNEGDGRGRSRQLLEDGGTLGRRGGTLGRPGGTLGRPRDVGRPWEDLDLWTTSWDLGTTCVTWTLGLVGRPGPCNDLVGSWDDLGMWDDLGTTWTFGRPHGTLGRRGETLRQPGPWDDLDLWTTSWDLGTTWWYLGTT